MSNIFLAAMLFVLSVTMFSFSTSYGALDRAFQGIDENIFRQSINVTDASRPFFDQHILEKTINNYLSENLDSYKPMIKYRWSSEPWDGFSEDGVWRVTWVDLEFYGDFLSSYHYYNTVSFYIIEGDPIYG